MTKRTLFALCAVLLSCIPVHAQRPSRDYGLSAIRAKLFYENTGEFSRDILADPNIALWNTIIGEGGSGGPSNSTLVIVEVSGPAGDYNQNLKVEFTASYRTNGPNRPPTVIKRVVPGGIMNDKGKFYSGFWLYDTGCSHVNLTARLLGLPRPSTMTKTIKFECGE